MRPTNIGIHALEVYFPNTYIDQTELETHSKTDPGKFTIGLGQNKMACVGDREDINSIMYTVLHNLLEKYEIDPQMIGRLEVGTESFYDKSKSGKTFLMTLFPNNSNIEGITTFNACYGGTQALFNSVAWIESSAWDGRYAIVVAADIALLSPGPARPTGGCGAVAMLIGPQAPIVLDPVRYTHIEHAYDFYKPLHDVEYPVIDGKNSLQAYTGAFEQCYLGLLSRLEAESMLDVADYFIFHSPFYKQAKRGYVKMALIDYKRQPDKYPFSFPADADVFDRRVYKTLEEYEEPHFERTVEPCLKAAKELGNTYTASIFVSLASLIENVGSLSGKSALIFSYGSGLASSLYRIRFSENSFEALEKIRRGNMVFLKLAARIKVSPEEYDRRDRNREIVLRSEGYEPKDDLAELREGTYYLERIDGKNRRFYSRKTIIPRL